MSGSLNQMPKYQARLPKTGHDIGRDFYFTASVGQILPIYRARLNQGETIDMKFAMNIQARPLRRPTAMKIRQKIDVFFVPEQLLYTAFGQHYYQTNDFLTSAFDPGGGPQDNYLPLLEFNNFFADADHDRQWLKSNTLDYVAESSLTNLQSARFDCFAKSAYRLLMHLGYNPAVVFKCLEREISGTVLHEDIFGEFEPNQYSTFADFLLAYNAIYQNYYRNDDREKRDIYTYQADWMNSGYDVSGVLEEHKSMFFTRCHSRIMDYFTSLKVSPIASVLNTANFRRGTDGNPNVSILMMANNYLSDTIQDARNNVNDSLNDSTLGTDIGNRNFTQVGTDEYMTTSTIRSLFAVEKLMRIYGRAKKDYDSQTLAHLGYKVPRDIKHEITFIGSIDGGIGVKQIISMAGTETTELGELAGNASGFCGGKVNRFTAPCHGVIMAVTYALPEVSYSLGTTHDKLTDLQDRLDLYIPEFDSLGMQPMNAIEPFNLHRFFGLRNTVIGWQYRYEQYKRQYDVHSVAFHRPTNYLDEVDSSDLPENSWSPWVVAARPFDCVNLYGTEQSFNGISLPYNAFLVPPTYLNGIMVQDYDPTITIPNTFVHDSDDVNYVAHPWLMFQTDPFMLACRCDVKLVSTMSTYGEPELI